MIKYLINQVPPLGANCYTVYDTESKNCLIIDLGGDFSKILGQAQRLGLTVKGVVLTHGHFDHVAGAVHCKEHGIPVYISREDAKMLSSKTNLSEYAGYGQLYFEADKILSEGANEIGGIKFEVIKTPGHTIGSICILIDKILFSGDTLFALSYGRYDFPTGDFSQLKNSIINKLFTLDGQIEVLPGHEGKTTINHERKYNPINEDNY